jgi:Ala-tRNA(Pro) deacylase
VSDAYDRLMQFLAERGISCRTFDHAAEGRTDLVSAMRGNQVKDAAKCIVLIVKLGKKTTKYVLAVVPGDARVSFDAVKALYGATYVSFASADIAERLGGAVVGTILPFSFDPELELVVDPALSESPEIFFNAGRLDRSIAIKTSDYLAAAKAKLAPIAASIQK